MANCARRVFSTLSFVKAGQLIAADSFDVARNILPDETGAKTVAANLEVAKAATF